MSDRAALCGRSTENRHAENDYACMNGSSREQYIWQSPSVLPRTITNAHRSFRFPCPRLRLPPRELHCCGACCSNRNDKCDPIFADAKADAPTKRQHERATIRATAIPVGGRNENFRRYVRRQWSGPLQHHLMAWRSVVNQLPSDGIDTLDQCEGSPCSSGRKLTGSSKPSFLK
jgi:hypothetical protein